MSNAGAPTRSITVARVVGAIEMSEGTLEGQMGQEILCQARFGGKTSPGKAMLETDYVLFRGDFRVKIAFREMKSVAPREGWLEIASPAGPLALKLGAAAEKWAHKILHPPSRLEKLGIKCGMRVSVINVEDGALAAEIAACGAETGASGEVILYGASKKAALGRLKTLARAGAPVWVIYPKGVAEIREADVIAAIRAAGLVDVKVASFSPTHTALKAAVRKK